MRKIVSISVIVLLSLSIIFTLDSCKKETIQGLIKAYVSSTSMCPLGDVEPNFIGDHLYAYRQDGSFGVPTIQAGGYTSDDKQELGVNIFEQIQEDFEEGATYYVTDGSDLWGSGYLFYFPNTDLFEQYISLSDQDAVITIETLKKTAPDPESGIEGVEELVIVIDGNIRMVNFTTGDTICVKDITIEVTG